MSHPPFRGLPRLLAVLYVALCAAPLAAHAICNVIPAASGRHRGALGSLDRPFALPGDSVQVTLDPACDSEVPGGFQDLPGGTAREDDYVVTVLFTPPSGARNAVVVAKSCAAVNAKLDACAAALGGATATCVDASSHGGQSPLTIPANQLTRLSFRFPDTDALFGAASDGRTLAGPATVAVTSVAAPLPCGAGAPGARCAAYGQEGLYACVDELFQQDGSCRTASELADPTFTGFTALPKANDYRRMVEAPLDTEVRFAVDRAGNALLPMDWSRVQLVVDGNPYPRQVRTTLLDVPVMPGSETPLRVRAPSAVSAWSPNGVRLPPVFTPLPDATSATTTLFGTIDAPLGVTRLARRLPVLNRCVDASDEPGIPCASARDCPAGERCLPVAEAEYRSCTGGEAAGLPCLLAGDCPGGTCGATTCRGGARDGLACATDGECPSGACGPALFDLAGFVATEPDGVGPGIVPAGAYAAEAQTPTTLEGQNETEALFAFVRPERIDGADANGDADATDPIVEVRSRATGATQPIGVTNFLGTAPGRAVARVLDVPFRRSALAVEDDLVAFLEPEALQGAPAPNKNGDLDERDHLLRVFRLGIPEDLAETFPPTLGDPDPVIDRASLAVSDGLVFFTSSERDQAVPFLEYAAQDADGLPAYDYDANNDRRTYSPRLSAGGRFFVWRSQNALVPGAPRYQIYLRDRCIGGGIPVLGCVPSLELVSANDLGEPATGDAGSATISGNGRYVAFGSLARNLVDPPETASDWDVFVRDRCSDELGTVAGCVPKTIRITPAAVEPAGGALTLSHSGRFVLYRDDALPGAPLYLHDRDADGDGVFDEPGATSREIVSLNAEGLPAPTLVVSGFSPPSDDGRFVVFISNDCTGQPVGCGGTELFLRDRCLSWGEPVAGCRPSTSWASVPPAGAPATSGIDGFFLTPDGRKLTFLANGPLYLRDLERRLTARVDYSADGVPVARGSWGVQTDAQGRHAVYQVRSAAIPGGASNRDDIAFADLTAGTIEIATRTEAGNAANNASYYSNLSRDGTTHLFGSRASNLLPFDTTDYDSVLRTFDLAPASPAGDLTGDGLLASRVLRVFEPQTQSYTLLGALRSASVADGNAAFLDEATGDVRLWRNRQGGPPASLGRAADEIALTSSHLVARVDGEVQLNPVAQGTAGAWIETGEPALPGSMRARGTRVAYLAHESALGAELTQDGDGVDVLPRVWDADAGLVSLTTEAGRVLPARDIVLGDEIAAFRVREGDLCTFGATPVSGDNCAFPPGCISPQQCDLDGDGTCCQDVLFAKDLAVGGPAKTQQDRVVVCDLEACDPRQPYRVKGASVRFLEPEQGRDLNANGLTNELLVRLWNVRSAATVSIGVVAPPDATAADPFFSGDPDPLADGPGAGGDAEGDPGASVVRSQGLCVSSDQGTCPAAGCAPGFSCVENRCRRVHGACSYCTPGTPGCTPASDCPVGIGATCIDTLVTAVVADSDGDGILDPFDGCPLSPDAGQDDTDGDGIGDACDAATCGNGVRELDEVCDDGNTDDGDACSATCTLSPSCLEGPDADADGISDACDVCTLVPNGPAIPDAGGASQRDADGDGFGNLCDGDFNQDGVVNFADLALLKQRFFSGDPVADLDGNGVVNFADLARFRSLFLKPPGPAAP